MRWIGGRESSNVEDRRGLSAGGGVAIGGGLIGVIFLVIKLLSGGDVSSDIQQQVQNQPQEMTAEEKAKDDERAKFVSVVLGYTEDVWDSLFAVNGRQYVKPRLVLFRDRVESACGVAGGGFGAVFFSRVHGVFI